MKKITINFTTNNNLNITIQGDNFEDIEQIIRMCGPKSIQVNSPEHVRPSNNGKPVTK